MPESNTEVSRRFTDLFSTDDPSGAPGVLAADVVVHGLQGGDVHGREAFMGFVAGYRSAFPDAISTVEQQVADGDMVVTRWRARGTHDGPLGDLPATGRPFDAGGMTMERFVDRRIVEVWVVRDELGLLGQLGVRPQRAAAVEA